jgi:3,4-dihydroxy 2-butanone 4-phosphate synthase/GTP cyclohydrolase II
MHTLSLFADIFGEESDRAGLLSGAMKIIAEEGTGVVVVINKPIQRMMSKSFEIKQKVRSGDRSSIEELRDYGVGAQILAELGIHDMVLLTNTHHSLVALEGYGLSISGERRID